MPNPVLSPSEARVLGVLAEKEKTVPDSYPMSLNAIATGCNQKTSRDPVMDLSDAEVLAALDGLRGHHLVMDSFGNRVTRYSHNIGRVLNIPYPAVALVVTLTLRGPQTAAELRANSERLYAFADTSSVEAFLNELAERAVGALVRLMPRVPGAREARWVHLLCGEPAPVVQTSTPSQGIDDDQATRIAALEARVAQLSNTLAKVCAELGIQP